MSKLTNSEIESALEGLAGWSLEGAELVKYYVFKDFVAALAFVNRLGDAAEAARHHPDIDIRYNRVRLGLSTHDAGGISAKDTEMAAQADTLSKS